MIVTIGKQPIQGLGDKVEKLFQKVELKEQEMMYVHEIVAATE